MKVEKRNRLTQKESVRGTSQFLWRLSYRVWGGDCGFATIYGLDSRGSIHGKHCNHCSLCHSIFC